jgi:hypothetical protein
VRAGNLHPALASAGQPASRQLRPPPALAPQEFALRYLNKQALACYWLQLLREYTRLLGYDPGQPGGGAAGFEQPLDEALEVLREHPEMQADGAWPRIELPGPMRELPAVALEEAPSSALSVATWSRWLHDDPALETPEEMAAAAAQLPLGEPARQPLGEPAGRQPAAGGTEQQPAAVAAEGHPAVEAAAQQLAATEGVGQHATAEGLVRRPAVEAAPQQPAAGITRKGPAAPAAPQQPAAAANQRLQHRRLK